MPHVHIEMIGGLAGDMFIAAALDAGLIEVEALAGVLSQVGLGQIKVRAERVMRFGIQATHVSFAGWDPIHEADHRHLSEIQAMIDASGLDEAVKAQAQALFLLLGEAESAVHNIPLEQVHFHEIGAVDSILDFIGAAYVITTLNATWTAGNAPQGRGMIQTAHGTMAALAPAAARLLVGYVLEPRKVKGELVTPTGATLLRALTRPGQLAPSGALRAVGYGAGTRDVPGLANVVRLSVSEVAQAHDTSLIRESIVRLGADIDDMTPEALAWSASQLLAQGALDVVTTPALMKKGRAGATLTALCLPDDAERLAEWVLLHTSTLGVRVEPLTRLILGRRIDVAQTPYGEVRLKVALRGEEAVKAAPEYEDCARQAQAHQVSVSRVYEAALTAWRAAQR